MEKLISIKNLSFCFDKTELFCNINLDFFRDDKILICGKNGSGKSTFLEILAKINQNFSGEIAFKENLKISYLFQNSMDQFVAPNVIEDVSFSLLCEKIDQKIAKQKSLEILEKLEILHLKNRSLYNLSGGEKRIVAIAGTLVRDADIYLLDEPFNELDESKISLVLNLLKDKTFILISHQDQNIKNCKNFQFTKNGLLKSPKF